MSDRLIFITLPVADVAASRAFFSALGFAFNDQFADEQTACMVVSDKAFVMLGEKEKFTSLLPKDVMTLGDPRTSTTHLQTYSVDSREAVDAALEAAVAAGGTPVGEDDDYGFMYSRAFLDLDGHGWSAMWMDPAVASGEKTPEEVSA